MAPLLVVENLGVTVAGSGASVLDSVSFALAPGEVLGCVGESGSGKSVLALTIMGLLPPALRRAAGRIALDGARLDQDDAEAWRAKRGRDLAMVFQEPMTALNPVMPVGRQVAEVMVKRRGFSPGQARAETLRLFERVEIPSAARRLSAYPHELSGGLRQRVMIAMALAAEPQLLIADEPTTALDVTIQAQILDLLRDLQRERGLALLLITHDLGVVAELADRVMVLYAGRVAEIAPARRLFDAPAHPYTRALLASVPSVSSAAKRLASIEGVVPSADALPPGCRFAPRCAHVMARCATMPALAEVEAGHSAACWLTAEAGAPA